MPANPRIRPEADRRRHEKPFEPENAGEMRSRVHQHIGEGSRSFLRLGVLGKRKDKQGIAAAGVAEPGSAVAGESGRPAAPADAHGDVLPAVEHVRDRAGMVSRSALKGPEVFAGLRVVGGEEPFGIAGEDKTAAGRQHAGDHRRSRGHLPLDPACRHIDRLERARGLIIDQGEGTAPVGLALDEKCLARGELGAIVDHRHEGELGCRVISHRVPFLAAGRPRANADARFRRQRGRVDERPSGLGVEPVGPFGAVGPGDLAERLAVEELRRSPGSGNRNSHCDAPAPAPSPACRPA